MKENQVSKALAEPMDASLEKEARAQGLSALEIQMLLEAEEAKVRSRLKCADGTSLSAQANKYVYCSPRENWGPHDAVEVGFPSQKIEEIMDWAEDPLNPTETVYARVPIGVVAYAMAKHGGRADAQKNWTVSRLGRAAIQAKRKVKAEPGRCGYAIDGLKRKSKAWIQAVVLGSPNEEGEARFEIWRGNRKLLDWRAVMSCFLAAGAEESQKNDGLAWIKTMRERVALEIAAPPAQDKGKKSFSLRI